MFDEPEVIPTPTLEELTPTVVGLGGGVRAQVYCADARALLPVLAPDAFPLASVLLVDPPYAGWRYLEDTKKAKRLSVPTDVSWQAHIFYWVSQWLFLVRDRMTPDASAWIFCNQHYLGFYVRWGAFAGWQWQHLFSLGNEEYLLYFAPEPLAEVHWQRLFEGLPLNKYGHDKSVEMLKIILGCSPDGVVLDPFVGGGHTLLAAAAIGRDSVGIEITPELAAKAVQRLRSAI